MTLRNNLLRNAAECLARNFATPSGRALVFVLHSYECQLTATHRCLCGATETRMFLMEGVRASLTNVKFTRYTP